ncbi:hypothetical protein LCGC14_2746570, partial [marine sediment metagenome]
MLDVVLQVQRPHAPVGPHAELAAARPEGVVGPHGAAVHLKAPETRQVVDRHPPLRVHHCRAIGLFDYCRAAEHRSG